MDLVAPGWLDQRGSVLATPPLPDAPCRSSRYVYRCVDESWLTAWLASRVAPWVERRLFRDWTANTVTLAGSGLMWVWLAGVGLAPPGWRAPLGVLWTFLLWAYCVLDHVDGCRARSRGTSAPWGEFLDHALDAWHAAILVVAAAVVAGAAVRPAVVTLTLAAAGVATVATWLDQKWRGEIFLGRLGPVESVVLAGLFVASHAVPGASAWWQGPLPVAGGTRAEGVFLLGAAGALGAAVTAVRRAPAAAGRLAVFLAGAAAFVGSGLGGVPSWVVVLALTLAMADASARVLVSHLARRPAPWPDVGGAALLVIAAGAPGVQPIALVAALIWLGVRAALAWRSAWLILPAR